ncbi:MAG TPA: hypothetical protein DEP69_04380, partial [Acidimicrobiaceae bacterium]|nr:hypothetical protein [Acidimicrobiaceae bacterium]
LRLANCRLPRRSADDFRVALSLLPSTNCTPQTAPPGTSNHEAGLAVDFTCGGTDPIGRSSRCYRWLLRRGHEFGFYNFVSEPWHWSTDGR